MIKCKIEGCYSEHYGKGLCHKHYTKQYYLEHKKRIIKYNKQWRIDNPEYCKQYKKDNNDKIIKQRKQYKQDHKKETKQYNKDNKKYIAKYMKQWQRDNKEQLRQYYQDNKEQFNEQHKRWLKTPAGKASNRASGNNRRTLTKDLTLGIVQRVYADNIKKYGVLTCYLCFKPIAFGRDCLEHSIPLVRGGSNDYENLGVAHGSCNQKKFTKTLEEWFNKNKKEIKVCL